MTPRRTSLSKHCESARLLDSIQMSEAEREDAKQYMDQADTFARFVYSVEHGIEHAAAEFAHGVKEAVSKLVHH